MKLEVLYEDNHLLSIVKPPNMPVQEDSSKDLDLLNAGKKFLVEKYNKPGDAFLGLVHRLDRPVGGAMIFAKTSKAASRLSNEIRLNKFDREYLAIVRGLPQVQAGRLTDHLLKDNKRNQSSVVKADTKNSKKAILDYKVLQMNTQDNMSLVSVQLQTGRSHQIRVQLAHMGYPIYGDQKYGSHVNTPGEQIALWASDLAIKHPTLDEIVKVSSTPPAEYPWTIFGY